MDTPTAETENGLSGELAELRAAIADLNARLTEKETSVADDARFQELNSALRDFDTRFDALENRVELFETDGRASADVNAAPADIGVDPAWLRHIFEKYFWNERPVPVAPSDGGN